jgi:cytochrome c oxidase assembly protein subunit 15
MQHAISKDRSSLFHRVGKFTFALTFIVVVLGAFVRLSDAGLGCPDWPGCYGHIGVPDSHDEVTAAEALFGQTVETDKAWIEMIHRYAASAVGFLILIMCGIAAFRRKNVAQPVWTPFILLCLVMCQGLLGMWTVTLLVKPIVVSAHLMGGMSTLGLLWWILLTQGRYFGPRSISNAYKLRRLAGFALVVLVIQTFLGAWTSTNYAATACGSSFPSCQSQWWPAMDFSEGFVLWRGLGVNYEGGVLAHDARTAIQVVHRIGAAVTTLVLAMLVIRLKFLERDDVLNQVGSLVALALAVQLSIGIAMVWLNIPLVAATAHNAGAALLLLSTLAAVRASTTTPGL